MGGPHDGSLKPDQSRFDSGRVWLARSIPHTTTMIAMLDEASFNQCSGEIQATQDWIKRTSGGWSPYPPGTRTAI